MLVVHTVGYVSDRTVSRIKTQRHEFYQIARCKTSWSALVMAVPLVDDLSNCLLSLQVQLYMRSGSLSPNNTD